MDSIFNLSVIIAAVDNLTGPVREMVRSMEGLDRMAARGREMQDWGTRMSIAGAMTQGAANQMMAAINGPIEAAAQFEQSMALVRAVTTNITGDEFEALSAQARELGATTAFSASQAAEGMGFLARAGFDAQEQMAAMPSMLALARAGAVDLGTTADIASNILSGFGLDAAEMTRVADVMVATFTTANTDIPMLGDTMRYIAPVARAAGMSLEEAAAMAGLLGNAGIQSSQAGTTLRAMLQRLAAPSREAAAALDAMGVSVADEQGNMRSMVTILGEVGDAIGDLGTQQQLDIIGTIFGVEAAAGAAELLAQGQSIGDYVDQLMASQGRAAQVAAEMGDNFRGAQTEFASAMEGLNITLGTMLLPVLTDVARAATGVVQSIMGWAEANPTIAGIALRAALLGAGVLAVVAPILSVVGGFAMMAGVGLQVVSRIGVAFVWLAPKIWAAGNMVVFFIGRLLLGAATAIPSFISGLVAMGAAAAGRVVAGLRAAAVAARAFGLALMANPIGLAVAAIAAGALLVWYYWEPISEFFVDLWADVQTAFEGFSSWVTSWWSRVTGWLAQGLDWARMIPSLSWADFVGLLTWENFLTVLDWLSWLIPLRWLDFIPGFSWAEVIGAVLDWADWISGLSWSEFVALFTWDNALQVLEWASWVLPIRWLDFIPGFSWSAVIGAVLDWADWITSLSWSEFVALFTWDNALQVLDWVSWVSPLRWLDFIPGFSWSAVIGAVLDWADWITGLSWSEFVALFTWDNALQVLDWVSWVSPLRWLDFIPGFSWSAVIGAVLDWADWITGLSWSEFVALFTWDNALQVLDWASWVLPIRWLDFIPGFSWSAVIGAVLDWADWITSLSWSEFVALFTWDNALQVLDWVSWVSPLRWLDFIPGFSWAAIIQTALDWGGWVVALDWSSYVPSFSWAGVLTALDWASWLIPLRWLDFIPGFSWAEVIGSALSWGDWITSLDWSAYLPAFSWSGALTALDWASWILPIRWLDFIPGFSWAEAIGSALSWGDWITSLDWSAYVPSFDLSGAVSGAVNWLTWISPLNWLDYIPAFSWSDVLPEMPALDWSTVATAMQAPFETAFAAITAIWDGMRALFAWSPLETIREAFGGIGETVVGIISGAADMAGAAWNRLTTIFSSGDAAEMAIRDPASIERAQAAVEALASALERLEGVDFAPAQTGVEAVGVAAGQSIAQAGGIPAAAEAAIRSATAVLQGVSFRSHGIAFMRSLAEGIRAGAAQAIEATRETVQAMRDHLPHSPAKVGPLSDLDRVRFSETVAGAVRPAPAVAAVHRLTAGMAAALAGATMSLPAMAAQVPEIGRTNLPVLQAASALPQVGLTGEPGSAPAMAGTGAAGADAGTRVEINFNPTITMQGGAGGGDGFQSREQMQELLRSMGHELVQLVQDELARQSRRDY